MHGSALSHVGEIGVGDKIDDAPDVIRRFTHKLKAHATANGGMCTISPYEVFGADCLLKLGTILTFLFDCYLDREFRVTFLVHSEFQKSRTSVNAIWGILV